MSLFALDLVPGLLVGGLVGAIVGGLAYGIDWCIRALWRWLRQPKAAAPLGPASSETSEKPHHE